MAMTEEQAADVALYDRYLRGTLRDLMKVCKAREPVHWNQFAVDRVDGVLATLDDSEVVPNNTGLAGAVDLTVAEFRQLQTIARTLSTMVDENRGLLVKAIGVNADM